MTEVLIVEDETHLAEGLRFNLEAEGFKVEVVGDGESALHLLMSPESQISAVVLDVMLPGIDGFEVASKLRESGRFVPVMMLTARGRPEDVLKGFAAGADDYLPKPFELSILVARLQSLIRRNNWQRFQSSASQTVTSLENVADHPEPDHSWWDIGILRFDDREIDFDGLELRTPEKTIRLTLMETELLKYLALHAGHIVSRKSLLEDVWNLNVDTDTRAIDNFIVRLRRYVEEDPSRPRRLLTVRGVGYKFVLKD